MLVRSGGGGSGEMGVIHGTGSGGSWSASWGFSAESFIVFFQTITNATNLILVDVATHDYWLTNSDTGWKYVGTLTTGWNITPTSVSVTANLNYFDVIPLSNTPTGYFS